MAETASAGGDALGTKQAAPSSVTRRPDDDAKLLERLAQAHDNTRKGFMRELKLVIVLLLLFQFAVVFRYLDLHGESRRLEVASASIQQEREELLQIEGQLSTLRSTVQNGSSLVSDAIRLTPSYLQWQIMELGAQADWIRGTRRVGFEPPIRQFDPQRGLGAAQRQTQLPMSGDCVEGWTYRGGAPIEDGSWEPGCLEPGKAPVSIGELGLAVGELRNLGVETPANAGNQRCVPPLCMPNAYRSRRFLAQLTEGERQMLRSGDDVVFGELTARIVEPSIITPTFKALNQFKYQQLDGPMKDTLANTVSMLDAHHAILVRHGLTDGEARLGALGARIGDFTLSAPSVSSWWGTVRGKELAFNRLADETMILGADGVAEMQHLQDSVASFRSELDTLIRDHENKKQDVQKQLQQVQTNYDQVQSALKDLAKPVPGVSVEPRLAVLHYPILLPVLMIYFVWRFRRLCKSAAFLARHYRKLGASEELLRVSFPEGSSVTAPSASARRSLAPFVTLCGGLVLGCLMAISILDILGDSDLATSAPRAAYAGAVAIQVALTSVVAVWFLRELWVRWRPSEWPKAVKFLRSLRVQVRP